MPSDILRPPYVGSKKPPGINSGPEIHDEKGIECMRASGKLAAQVLQYAGTLVKVSSCHPFGTFCISVSGVQKTFDWLDFSLLCC